MRTITELLKLVRQGQLLCYGICVATLKLHQTYRISSVEKDLLLDYLHIYLPPKINEAWCWGLWDIKSRKDWIEQQIRDIHMRELFSKLSNNERSLLKASANCIFYNYPTSHIVLSINKMKRNLEDFEQPNNGDYLRARYWYYIYNFKAKKS